MQKITMVVSVSSYDESNDTLVLSVNSDLGHNYDVIIAYGEVGASITDHRALQQVQDGKLVDYVEVMCLQTKVLDACVKGVFNHATGDSPALLDAFEIYIEPLPY